MLCVSFLFYSYLLFIWSNRIIAARLSDVQIGKSRSCLFFWFSAFVQFLHNRLVSEQGDLFKFVHQWLLEKAVDPVVIMLLLIWMEKKILCNMEDKD